MWCAAVRGRRGEGESERDTKAKRENERVKVQKTTDAMARSSIEKSFKKALKSGLGEPRETRNWSKKPSRGARELQEAFLRKNGFAG
jgi:hypothetical protein